VVVSNQVDIQRMDETIKALKSGDRKAFSNLFENFYQALCRYSFSIIRETVDAEDVVQKIFFKLWDQHSELEIQSSIKSYLYRMVHNESINFIQQKTNRSVKNYEIVSSTDANTDDVNEQMAASDLQQAINKALENLPPQCRKAFELSRMEQKSYAEIAQNMNISTNTVENQISKSLRLLRIALKDYLVVYVSLQIFLHN